MTLPRRGLGLGSLDVIYQFEQMLHFTSLGLKENHSSCTGTNPCVCLSPSGWLVPLGPWRCRGGDRNSWASGCQPLPAPAAGPVAAAAGFKPLGLVTGLVSPCPNSQVASLMCQRGCARPGVPLLSSPIAQSLLWGCVLEAPGTQAAGWKALGEVADSPFSLRKTDQGERCVPREQPETQQITAQPWGSGEAANLAEAEKRHGQEVIPR